MGRFDIVIIGAGPAGLKAAEILAEHKKVLLFTRTHCYCMPPTLFYPS